MRNNSIESTTIYAQDFPMEWIEIGPKTFAAHVQHVVDLAKPQPVVSIDDVELFLPPNVYHPGIGLSSRFLVDALLNEGIKGTVLDLGCGSGFVGISLYGPGMDLILADISNFALVSATENLRRTGIPGKVVLSDLFLNLKGKRFDSILFNPPLFDKAVEHEAEIALCDPNGDLLTRFLTDASHYLTSNGNIYFTASNLMNREALLGGLNTYHYEIISSSFCARSGVSRWVVSARPKYQAKQ